jgi:hypothetical protein
LKLKSEVVESFTRHGLLKSILQLEHQYESIAFEAIKHTYSKDLIQYLYSFVQLGLNEGGQLKFSSILIYSNAYWIVDTQRKGLMVRFIKRGMKQEYKKFVAEKIESVEIY